MVLVGVRDGVTVAFSDVEPVGVTVRFSDRIDIDGDGAWVGGGVTVDERVRLVEQVVVTGSVAEGVTVGGDVIVAVSVADLELDSEFDTVRETV
jgi:cytoskeletal protein CcmA (bactofilin family)